MTSNGDLISEDLKRKLDHDPEKLAIARAIVANKLAADLALAANAESEAAATGSDTPQE